MRLKINALMLGAALALGCDCGRCPRREMGARGRRPHPRSARRRTRARPSAFNGQVYEPLVDARQCQQAGPGARDLMEADRSDDLGIQAAPERQIPQRRRVHADDVVFSFQRALQPTSDYKGYLANTKEVVKVDDHTVQHQDQGPEPDPGADNLTTVYIMRQGVGGGEQRHQAAGLQEQGRELRGAQRQRHRPVRAGVARAGREDRGEAQRRLLGPRRGSARDHRADADHRSSRTRRASPRCSPARSTSCRTCRCRTSSA